MQTIFDSESQLRLWGKTWMISAKIKIEPLVWTFSGKIYTFYRGCTDNSTEVVTENSVFKYYIRVCSSDLCNDWDGISSGGGRGGNERVATYVIFIALSVVMILYK